MTIEIIEKQAHSRGEIYIIRCEEKLIKLLLLFHAIERIRKWKLKEEMVIETLIMPEEVGVGHINRYIAHRRYGNHLVRAVYEYEGALPVLLTVYFPYTNRYFKGGNIYEDKIFKGS
jgi:hypothetical protein